MAIPLPRLLPCPGPVWGETPARAPDHHAPPWRGVNLMPAGVRLRRWTRIADIRIAAWHAFAPDARRDALAMLRVRLRREGLRPSLLADALGAAGAAADTTLGWRPRRPQLMAAAALLDQRMAEMATGEGKTLALALAAAAAALAGVPVHVVTANDYLAQRDAKRLAPLYAALGLTVAARPGAATDDARRAVYAHDIVYATAKDLAFDFLRDDQAGASEPARVAAALAGRPPPPPVMRGLNLALLDEADSILLDEAEVPLILSRSVPQAARRAFLWQALALARQLMPGRDFTLQPADRHVALTAAGEDRVAALAASLGGPWTRPRYRREAVHVALSALHLHRRDEHYVVRDGAVEVLDEVTGRIAPGRIWSRGLHTVIALKEGLRAPDETETVARTTFQRFFQRYWRLGGLSGTLWEARAELRSVYGLTACRILLHRPCRRVEGPMRRFDDADTMFIAAAERAATLAAAGRPVLIGTDSVADSQAVSARLAERGVAHRVLNALNDTEEAAIVAEAGRAGQVTVATRMAGRGTDIELDATALAAGGLHVLSCQHNPSRRLDRQLAGRAGRRGEPGSAEAWFLARRSGPQGNTEADNLAQSSNKLTPGRADRLAPVIRRWEQRRDERRAAAQRRALLKQDIEWERRLAFAGPSP